VFPSRTGTALEERNVRHGAAARPRRCLDHAAGIRPLSSS
jgi:hypothetical protein